MKHSRVILFGLLAVLLAAVLATVAHHVSAHVVAHGHAPLLGALAGIGSVFAIADLTRHLIGAPSAVGYCLGAQAMEYNQVGKREALADMIANAESEATPCSSMMEKRKKPGNVLSDWQVKGYRRAGHRGVRDGVDATKFNYNGRERIHAVAQKVWDPRGVSDFAQESEVAGIKTTEIADQTIDATVTVKQIIERRVLSNEDCLVQNESNPDAANETRGLFKWYDKDEQALYPVPEKFRPNSGQLYTGTLADFKESTLKSLAMEAWIRRLGNAVVLDGFCGIYLKAKISDFTVRDDAATGTSVPIRTFNQSAESKALINVIDVLHLDTGKIRVHPSAHIMTDADTGEFTASSHRSGIFLDMEMVGLAYTRMPRAFKLPYQGGGEKVVVDAIITLQADNPVGGFSARIAS